MHLAVLAGLVAVAASLEATPQPVGSELRVDAEAGRLVVVVVDALRSGEVANLAATRGLPHRATVRVECLLPSSTAAIETWTTGRVPTLRSFLSDFDGRVRNRGGLFEQLAKRSRQAVVVGPPLWTHRFAPWILASGDEAWGTSDAARVKRLCEKLAESTPPGSEVASGRLYVLHLDQLDRAAHLHEPIAPRLRAIDEALAAIDARLTAEDRLVVVSDHGRTRSGGHAGREAAVIETPVLSSHPLPPMTTQRDFAAALAGWQGVPPPAARTSTLAWNRWPLVVAACLIGLLLVAQVSCDPRVVARVTLANGFIFIAVLLGATTTALVVGGFAAASIGCRWGWTRFDRDFGATLALGGLLGSFRWQLPAFAAATPLLFLAGTAIACLAIGMCHMRCNSRRLLSACVLLSPMLQGQSSSLSTIQTRIGFQLLESGGPAAAVCVTALLHALPLLVGGAVLAGRCRRERKVRPDLPVVLIGLLLVPLVALIAAPFRCDEVPGLLVRLLCESAAIGVGGGLRLLLHTQIEMAQAKIAQAKPSPHRPAVCVPRASNEQSVG